MKKFNKQESMELLLQEECQTLVYTYFGCTVSSLKSNRAVFKVPNGSIDLQIPENAMSVYADFLTQVGKTRDLRDSSLESYVIGSLMDLSSLIHLGHKYAEARSSSQGLTLSLCYDKLGNVIEYIQHYQNPKPTEPYSDGKLIEQLYESLLDEVDDARRWAGRKLQSSMVIEQFAGIYSKAVDRIRGNEQTSVFDQIPMQRYTAVLVSLWVLFAQLSDVLHLDIWTRG